MDNILSIGEMQVRITRIADLRALPGMEWITALRAPAVAALARDGGPLHMPGWTGFPAGQPHDRAEPRGDIPGPLHPPTAAGLMRHPGVHHARVLGHIDRGRPGHQLHRFLDP
jgi:hypothetical protein